MSSPEDPSVDRVAASQSKKGSSRRGPKGHFQGSRKEFLESWLPAYIAAGKGRRQKFWHEFWCAWWSRYPWKLDDSEEPPQDDPQKMARLALVAPGEDKYKKQVEQKLRERLTQWFSNHASAKNGTRRDSLAWLTLLQRLHQLRNPRPRKRTAVQQFMLDYPSVVGAAFTHRYADGRKFSSVEKMNLRYDVATLLLAQKYSHLTAELEKKATEQHEADIDEWNLILDGVSFAEDVPRAHDTLFDAVHPLLQAIGSYANCYVSLIVGNADVAEPDGEFFTAVHWWPGDRKSAKNWTQWDEEAFNSGVAGPFLAYAKETNRALKIKQSSTVQPLQVPPLAPQSASGSVNENVRSADTPLPALMGSVATTTTLQARYRPLTAQDASSNPAPRIGKRKKATTRPIRYFEDTPSEDGEGDEYGGDGSSSGESVPFDDRAQVKRLRVSGTTAAVTPISPSSLRPPDSHANNMDASRADPQAPEVSPAEESGTSHEVETAAETDTSEPEHITGPAPIMDFPITMAVVPPPVSARPIDMEEVPAFLLSHSKGSRQVNIFKYLNELQDPHFQQVLYHYIKFETGDGSNANGTLPTAGRPVEISQWTSRARPANLPDYKKGGRTFRMFMDSILDWWSSIQPSWRPSEPGTVSREVRGDWEALRAPRINGLLNVVILVYWWGRILEECAPEDGVRADYECFADDVAWVFSHLST